MMKIEHIRKVFEENQVEKAVMEQAVEILRNLNLLDDLVGFERLSGHGMTNSLYLFETRNAKYLLRVPGEGTAQIINRQHEKDVYQALRGSDLSDKVLYISAENGFKISTFLEGCHTCDSKDEAEVRILVELIKKLHELNLSVPHTFDIFAEIERYERELEELDDSYLVKVDKQAATAVQTDATVKETSFGMCRYPDFAQVREQIFALRPLIEKGSGKKCLCHIDSVHDNCLIQDTPNGKEGKLIDWEYAGMCDPYIDVAMFNIYAEADKESADFAIATYLGAEDTTDNRKLIYAYMAAGAYLWVLWSEIKRASGVDYSAYEDGQYALAKEFCGYALD